MLDSGINWNENEYSTSFDFLKCQRGDNEGKNSLQEKRFKSEEWSVKESVEKAKTRQRNKRKIQGNFT